MRRPQYAAIALLLILTGAVGSLVACADQPPTESREATNVVIQAREFTNRGEYERALRLLRPLAVQGVASAQFALGSAYANGSGVVKDETQAVAWYQKAADQGHQFAMVGLKRLEGK